MRYIVDTLVFERFQQKVRKLCITLFLQINFIRLNIFLTNSDNFKFFFIRNNSLIAYYSRQIALFYIQQNNQATMKSKNMADYTNFEGKTNKKIVQPPGGVSSFSIGWSNERIDYGPERTFKKKEGFNNNEALFRSSNMTSVQRDYSDQRQRQTNGFDMITQSEKEKSVKSITVMSECTTQSSEGYEPFRNHKGEMPVYCQESQPRNQPVKTGVRVKYPPGGKSSIIFG